MRDDLSPKERAVLLTLLVHGPTLSNPEMATKVAHLTLDGKERRHLNEVGLVDSAKRRSFTHTLTEAGRKWCLDDLAAGAAHAGDSALERAFYSLLGVVRGKVDVQSLFGAAYQPPQPGRSLGEAEVEAAVRAAYKRLRREPGGWVSLADLRDRLDSLPRVNVDAALRRLNRRPGVVLVPESDQTSLTQRQRGAALTLGGQPQHLIKIEDA